MSQALSAIGGVPPYSWSAVDALPAGLSLSSSGVISGTPSAETAGAYYTIQVTDSVSNTATLELWITVLGVADPVPPVVEVLQRSLAIVPEVGVFIQSPLVLAEAAIVPEVIVTITLSVALPVTAAIVPEVEVTITNIPVTSIDLAVIPEVVVTIENQLIPVELGIVPEIEVTVTTPSSSEINYLDIAGVITFSLDSSSVNTIEIDSNIKFQAG